LAGDLDGDMMADIIGLKIFGVVGAYAETNGTNYTAEYLLIQEKGYNSFDLLPA